MCDLSFIIYDSLQSQALYYWGMVLLLGNLQLLFTFPSLFVSYQVFIEYGAQQMLKDSFEYFHVFLFIMFCFCQVEYANIEGKFYQDVHALELKYAELFKPLYEKVG